MAVVLPAQISRRSCVENNVVYRDRRMHGRDSYNNNNNNRQTVVSYSALWRRSVTPAGATMRSAIYSRYAQLWRFCFLYHTLYIVSAGEGEEIKRRLMSGKCWLLSSSVGGRGARYATTRPLLRAGHRYYIISGVTTSPYIAAF